MEDPETMIRRFFSSSTSAAVLSYNLKAPSVPDNLVTAGTLIGAADALTKGSETACSLLDASTHRLAAVKRLNSLIGNVLPSARACAEESDQRRKDGVARGTLDGIPMVVKDNFCMKGVATTAASKMLEGYVPQHESTVTARLSAAGAVIVGKTNMDEFGMGSFTRLSTAGVTLNPWCESRTVGGSSGGSAAAVASGAVFAAIGSDTGGSVRLPAAYSGLVGFKPSYGRLSRWGLIAYCSSLDCPGIFARTVKDTATIFGVLQGKDPLDSTTMPADAAADALLMQLLNNAENIK